ncbi:3,4-dihydroxy-2-butanone-4-phosphate synthase [Mycolicibacterium stellerae]|uniref:3,4-dihydroxy-2-butanone-4-phosphate synthase n=1 Tax=Mycolicibacterium stellerae TaxID=2358193 RepID=UPI000F0B3765|nr:3,4-dihydroxy-2-butanone-4-phosphate synthase [Mycolicibacterium stellerae]
MPTTSAPADALSRLSEALTAIAHGGMVLVADDADRENEGDLVMAAEYVDTDDMVFLLRHGSGLVCTPMSDAIADDLGLDLMVATNTDNQQTAFTVTVDAVCTGTGISAADRAATVRALADKSTVPADLRRPGHVFPLRARAAGVLERAGHTEASVDLMRLAGCRQVAVITELVADDGIPMSGPVLTAFAAAHQIPMISVAELVEHRRRVETGAVLGASAAIPTDHGLFIAQTYTAGDGVDHLVLCHGDVRSASATDAGVLVRVHSECLTGDVIGSRRCDCGSQLDAALAAIAAEGAGVLIYLRGQEGRGIGLAHKLAAYTLQETGHDTVDANIALGLPIDSRDYDVSAAVLRKLEIDRIRLITNNPRKLQALNANGISITERISTPPIANDDNITYLRTKRDRLGHLLDLPVALP